MIISISFLTILIFSLINEPWSLIVVAILSSIVSSFAVSAFYNMELHNTMDKYEKIGMVDYFETFEEAQEVIRKKIEKAKKVEIYLMYGSTFFKSNSTTLKQFLAKTNSSLTIFLYNTNNPFIDSYGNHWSKDIAGDEYNSKSIVKLIEQVKSNLSSFTELGKNSSFEIFEIIESPISYSYYIVDDYLFFVPSKNTRSKNLKPPVLFFKKTRNKKTMYYKIQKEIELMKSSNELKKI